MEIVVIMVLGRVFVLDVMVVLLCCFVGCVMVLIEEVFGLVV